MKTKRVEKVEKVITTPKDRLGHPLRLRIVANSAILSKSNEKLLPIYQKTGITDKQIAV